VMPEAITWMEIHGDRPEIVAHWRALLAEPRDHPHAAAGDGTEHIPYLRRPRRRRRRRGQGFATNR
jgi:hypothetical protein